MAMDELEISGKRYISTRRAAREHGYHSDYMGQLIRGKKVIGQKVGRAWYIEEDSLNTYLGKAPAPAPAPKAAPVEEVQPAPVERLVVEAHVPAAAAPEPEVVPVVMQPEPMAAPAPVVEIKKEEVEQPVAIHVVPEVQQYVAPVAQPVAHPYAQSAAREIHHAPYIEEHETRIPIHAAPHVQSTGGLRYAEDDAPVMPIVARASVMPQAPMQAPAQQVYAQPAHTGGKFPYISLSIVAVLALAVAAFASNFVTATVVSEEGKTATVQYAIHW